MKSLEFEIPKIGTAPITRELRKMKFTSRQSTAFRIKQSTGTHFMYIIEKKVQSTLSLSCYY